MINDASPSWAFNTPSMTADILAPCELRIFVDARLQGTYWAGSTSGSADLTVEGEPRQEHIGYTTAVTYDEDDTRTLEIEATLAGGANWAFTMCTPTRSDAATSRARDKAPF